MRRHFLAGLALACLAAVSAQPAHAQDKYPSKPIKMIVSFAVGGPTDIVARIMAARMGEVLGQQIIVDNRPGAGGNLGADVVAKSPPDGYTLLAITLTHAVNATLFPAAPYNLQKDLAPVAVAGSLPLMVVVNANAPYKSLSDLIAAGRQKQLNGGSSGNGTPPHLGLELLARQTGMKVQHVPYKGGVPSLTDLMGGQIDLIVSNFPESLPHVKSGKLRALAVTGKARHPLLPDVPTVAELGLPQLEITNWTGIMVPAGTPADVVAKINGDANAALAEPEMRAKIVEQGFEPVAMTPAEARAFVDAEVAKWGRLVRDANIKPD